MSVRSRQKPGLERWKAGLLASVMVGAAALPAQVTSGRGDIVGRVLDGTGAAIPGAVVTVHDVQRGTDRVLRADGAGLYSAPSLEVGTYTVTAHANTFSDTRIDDVNLTVGSTVALDLKLSPAAVGTQVEVGTDSDLTHRTEIDNASLIGNAQVEDLPTRGRNFTDFALLTPGISQEVDRFGLVINGQRSSNVYISVDGVDFNDSLQGGQRGGNNASVYFFPQVAVQEFQVVRTGVSADVGRTNGGFVNVVTKSGTNRFHGEAFYDNRNPTFTWSDPFNDPSSNNVQNQFGGAIGGPILHDKLFFFAGVEKNLLQVPFFVRFTTPAGYCEPNVAQTGQVPCSSGLTPLPAAIDALQVNSYSLNNPLASFGRLDYQVNPTNRVTLQYTSTFLSGLGFGISGVQSNAASNNTDLTQSSQGYVLGLTSILGGRRTNDLKFQYAYDNRQQTPLNAGAQIDIGDLGTIGGNSSGTLIYRATRYEVVDNYALLLGRHSIRFGVDVNLSPQMQQREANANGDWTIGTFAEYVAALPVSQGGGGLTAAAAGGISFAQTLPAGGGAELQYHGTQREFAGYIEDTFKVLPRVTLQAGFRYEAELEPQPPTPNPALPQTGFVASDLTQYQPRLGLAWDAYGTGKTVLRASGGLLDARTPAYVIARSFTDNGITDDTLNTIYNPTLLNQVPYLGQLAAPPAGTVEINDVYVNTANFKNPRSVQAALSLTQQTDRHGVLTIGYVQNETYDLQHRLDINLFPPTINALTLYPVFPKINPLTGVACTFQGLAVPCRPNMTIAGLHTNYSSAHSTYRALQMQYARNFSQRIQGTISYTWASDRDDDSNERDFNRELALDPLCTACYNKGYSKQDIRSQGNVRALYRLPLNFTLSTAFTARTPLPYNATLSGGSADQNNDGNTNNDRPILCGPAFTVCNTPTSPESLVTGRDTFRQPGFLNWDLRLIKSFKLRENQRIQFSAEGFNISRASNKNFGTNEESKFGKPQATINPNTGFYYSNNAAGITTSSPATNRAGGPRQIQLGARYQF